MSLTIIGFGRRTSKDYGAIVRLKCPQCFNDATYHLIQTRAWFTWYFIPIFPYHTEYYAECQICAYGVKLQADEVTAAKQGTLKIYISHD